MDTPEAILRILDRGAESFVFPMLDNGYVYLGATRLSLHRSDADWALVFEVFGFSPRAGLPDLCICTFASRLRDRDRPDTYASRDAYQNYLRQHPNDDSRYFFPLEQGPWQDAESDEFVADDATELVLRGRRIEVPSLEAFRAAGIALAESPRVHVFELCRLLAERHRDLMLATPDERRVSVPEELTELLVLDDWTHPDLVNQARPSATPSFCQLAAVLSSGETTMYDPTTPPNTHWRNWPDGGSL